MHQQVKLTNLLGRHRTFNLANGRTKRVLSGGTITFPKDLVTEEILQASSRNEVLLEDVFVEEETKTKSKGVKK